MYNHANGLFGHVHHFHHFRAFEHVISLPVFLEEMGDYRTAQIGKYHLGPKEVYRFQHELHGNERNPVEMANNCLDFLKENKKQPFFLYFCTGDLHRADPVADTLWAPNSFGNTTEGYPGIVESFFSPKDVIVPPYLPNTKACREELAQYYQSVARMDQGIGLLFKHLKEQGIWDNTVIVYISDNGIAFEGAKTTQYQPGINMPCIVKLPENKNAGSISTAYVNWADLTPTLVDLAGFLEPAKEKLKKLFDENKQQLFDTHNETFHGRSFKQVLLNGADDGWDETYASHTFHEITMYYPMRTVISGRYKLIWNLAWQLPYPQAADLWSSSTWQSALKSEDGMYGNKPIGNYYFRPEFELFDLENDPYESKNLSENPEYAELLVTLKEKIKAFQHRTNDPWVEIWERNKAIVNF
jgi:N-sulfoglucosamine sulfohydrolase